ncbi:MAG TPA: PAS domain-containing protein [Candidatus Deferrimicrobiaceae bacterium]
MKPIHTGNEYFRTLFDAIPSPVIIVDEDVRIEDANIAGIALLGSKESIYRKKGGDILRCLQASLSPGGCGKAAECKDCIIRNSVGKALAGEGVTRLRMRMQRHGESGVSDIYLLVTASPFVFGGRQLVLLQLEDINELVALQSLLPICAWCKKVRTGGDYWQSVEDYLQSHADVVVSHSICGECLARQLSEIGR